MRNVDLLGLYYKHYSPFYDALSIDVSLAAAIDSTQLLSEMASLAC
jgi:hypothetical protein